jgi:peptidoglycan/LPS O-acetylase OafA/YrhL
VIAHAGLPLLSGGFVGVDVFFVLSGFLITALLLAEAREHGSISFRDFYLRRARRIVPAAALTLLVTNIAAFFLLNFVRVHDAVSDSLYATAFAANVRFAARGVDYFAQDDPPSPLLHYWSLSVEEQFYVVWPLLLALLVAAGRRGRRSADGRERRLLAVVLVLAGFSLAWSIHLTAASPTAAYFSPLTRGWELGLGAIVAVCASTLARIPAGARVALGWGGVAAIGVAAVTFSYETPFPGSAALLPTLGTALAIAAGIGRETPRLAVARILALRPMCIVGDRSYALYLWHWPVLILADQYAGRQLSTSAKLLLVAAAFLLSCLSYALVENPIRRRVRGRVATVLVVAACVGAVLASAAVSLAGAERAERRFEGPQMGAAPVIPIRFGSPEASTAQGALPAVVAAVAAARRGAPIPSGLTPRIDRLKGLPRAYAPRNECIGHDQSRVSRTQVCRLGRRMSSNVIVLMGDSHAMMWLPAVVEMARRDGRAVVPLLRLGCTPAKWTSAYGKKACHDWYRWALHQIRLLDPELTLLAGSIDEQLTPLTRAAINGILTAATTLKGRPVVVVGDPEGLNRDPVDCVLSRRASMATCTTTWPRSSLAPYDEIARRVPNTGAGFLRTRGFVCFERQCPAVIGRTIAWADTNHLSAAYSAQVAAAFRAGILRANPKRQR